MSDEEQERRISDSRGLERHLSSIGVAITVLVLGWVSTSIMSQTESIAVLHMEVKHIKEIINSSNTDRYTGTNAIADKMLSTRRMDSLGKRVTHLEEVHDRYKNKSIP